MLKECDKTSFSYEYSRNKIVKGLNYNVMTFAVILNMTHGTTSPEHHIVFLRFNSRQRGCLNKITTQTFITQTNMPQDKITAQTFITQTNTPQRHSTLFNHVQLVKDYMHASILYEVGTHDNSAVSHSSYLPASQNPTSF